MTREVEPGDPAAGESGGLSMAGPMTLTEATALLDWLEREGIEADRVEFTPDGLVTVWWRP